MTEANIVRLQNVLCPRFREAVSLIFLNGMRGLQYITAVSVNTHLPAIGKGSRELFATFATLMAADTFQTKYIFRHDEYQETNPLIDNYFQDEKVYGYFALTTLGAYLVADNLQPKYRKSFLRFLCAVQINVTDRNASLGIGFSF